MIQKLHHAAYRCRDSEQTRAFYEDFLGLPFVAAVELKESQTGRDVHVLHTFFRLDDGSHLAFFEAPTDPIEFKDWADFDLHIALEVERDVLEPMLEKGKAAGVETRGISDHGWLESIYFRDPNGYVIELCARTPAHDDTLAADPEVTRAKLAQWQANKPKA